MGSYGARAGGIVGVIGGRERPRVSADSTAIANCDPSLLPKRTNCQGTAAGISRAIRDRAPDVADAGPRGWRHSQSQGWAWSSSRRRVLARVPVAT
jgi:hypothetical protein